MDERCLDCEKSLLCLSGRHPEYEHDGNVQGLVWCPKCKRCFFLVPVPFVDTQAFSGLEVLTKSLRAADAFECPVRAESEYLAETANSWDSWNNHNPKNGWNCEDPVTGRSIAITHCPDCLPDVLRIEADVMLPQPLRKVNINIAGGPLPVGGAKKGKAGLVQGHKTKKASKTPPSGRHKKGGGKR